MSDWSMPIAAVATVVALVSLWRNRHRGQALLAARAELATAEQRARVCQRDLERLVRSLEGAVGGILVLDDQRILVACNQVARDLAELPPNGGIGRALRDLVSWPRLHQSLDQLQELAADQPAQPAGFDIEDSGPDGSRSLAVRLRALHGLGYAVAIDDHRRLKQLESLRRDFVANVSHELKTPLAAIQGFVETMIDDDAMPAAMRHRFLERIARQTARLSALVGDLLTLSRLDERQDLESGVGPCDFSSVVRETLRDLAPLAEKRQVQLRAEVPEVALLVPADREGLRQVVGNLVDNAIKYTPANGSVRVSLQVRGDRGRLDVVDTGIGLAPEDQERVFERFYRVDRARSRDLGGTGLGLSIVKNTVLGLGGDVGVQSTIGQGSTFWVELPTTHAVPPAG